MWSADGLGGKGCRGEALSAGLAHLRRGSHFTERCEQECGGTLVERSRFCSRRRERALIVCSAEDNRGFPEGYCCNESQLCHTKLFTEYGRCGL